MENKEDIRDYKILVNDLKEENQELRRLLDVVGNTVVELIGSSVNVNTPNKKKIEIDQFLSNEIALLTHENELYKYYMGCIEFSIENGAFGFRRSPADLIKECNSVVGLRRKNECQNIDEQVEKIIHGE